MLTTAPLLSVSPPSPADTIPPLSRFFCDLQRPLTHFCRKNEGKSKSNIPSPAATLYHCTALRVRGRMLLGSYINSRSPLPSLCLLTRLPDTPRPPLHPPPCPHACRTRTTAPAATRPNLPPAGGSAEPQPSLCFGAVAAPCTCRAHVGGARLRRLERWRQTRRTSKCKWYKSVSRQFPRSVPREGFLADPIVACAGVVPFSVAMTGKAPQSGDGERRAAVAGDAASFALLGMIWCCQL